MSTENWESPTWDWIEREIVDYLLIASKNTYKVQSFLNRLAKAPDPAGPSQKNAATQRRSASNA